MSTRQIPNRPANRRRLIVTRHKSRTDTHEVRIANYYGEARSDLLGMIMPRTNDALVTLAVGSSMAYQFEPTEDGRSEGLKPTMWDDWNRTLDSLKFHAIRAGFDARLELQSAEGMRGHV